jgi:hypothetical protein
MAIGSPTNAGFELAYIQSQLVRLDQTYTITSNRITRLDGFKENADRATVHLACRTEVEGGWGPTPSQWVLDVRRQEDDSWKIERITCISIAGRQPGSNWLW